MMLIDAQHHRLGVDPVRASLKMTGGLAIGTLILTLAMTPLQIIGGWKKTILYRRPLGLMAFFYAVAHASIFVVHDQELNTTSIVNELQQRRYLQIGTLAALMMVPLAMTSTPAMMKRLGLKRWKRLHRLIYPAAVLGVLHYALQSKADPYWRLGYIVLLTTLLAWRVHRWNAHRMQ